MLVAIAAEMNVDDLILLKGKLQRGKNALNRIVLREAAGASRRRGVRIIQEPTKKLAVSTISAVWGFED